MAKDWLEAIKIINEAKCFEIHNLHMDINKDTKHFIKHNFREEVIVPISSVTENIEFLLCKGSKTIITKDNIVCELVESESKNIVEFEDDIKRLYEMDAWSFLKRWYYSYKDMDSLLFVKMKLNRR